MSPTAPTFDPGLNFERIHTKATQRTTTNKQLILIFSCLPTTPGVQLGSDLQLQDVVD